MNDLQEDAVSYVFLNIQKVIKNYMLELEEKVAQGSRDFSNYEEN